MFRTEIQRLKDILSQVSKDCLGGKCQQEATRTSDENYSHMLEEKKNELKEVQKLHQEKFGHLQEIHDLVCQSKVMFKSKSNIFDKIMSQRVGYKHRRN